jgi:hypothetical protein
VCVKNHITRCTLLALVGAASIFDAAPLPPPSPTFPGTVSSVLRQRLRPYYIKQA